MTEQRVDLRHGDCRDILATLADESIDAVVTDPPYELAFMGRAWDATGIAYDVDLWREVLRVLKPGAHLAAFGATRTYHRMACAIEDAGFDIRDSIGIAAWVQGQGFPKSKSQLKPAWEPIVVARKPARGSVAACVSEHGTGSLNIDAGRVQMSDADREFILKTARPNTAGQRHEGDVMNRPAAPTVNVHAGGRWPANVVLVHAEPEGEPCRAECPVAEMDRQSGHSRSHGASFGGTQPQPMSWGTARNGDVYSPDRGDSGGASRFFPSFRYQAKAPASERPKIDGHGWPTVKPQGLMRWLVRLVTPPSGLVLDPFAGTGSTLQAARDEGFGAIGIERDDFAYRLAWQRLAAPQTAAAEPLSLFDPLDGTAS